MTAEIAPVVRNEAAKRADYDNAVAAETAKALAEAQLGAIANAATSTDATGARGVLAAAEVAVASAVEQRKYHQGRLTFEEQRTTPLQTMLVAVEG